MSAFTSYPALPSTPTRRRRPFCVCSTSVPRRHILRFLSISAAAALLPQPAHSGPFTWFINNNKANKKPQKPSSVGTPVFSVIPTSVSSVNLAPVSIDDVVADVASSKAVFLGEHHNSLVDHALQARIIDALSQRRRVVVGLEMVQQQFQPVLDAYVAGEIDELGLYLRTDWDTRWMWPYELYLPVFRLCRAKKIPLVALNMNSEVLAKVRSEPGIANLSGEELRTYIGNAAVFASISNDPAFKAYISECIAPSYTTHSKMGLLREGMNFNSFYAARVLRDEAMATRAVRALRENPNALAVCLMGGDHVKFEYGVKARVRRQLQALEGMDVHMVGADKHVVGDQNQVHLMAHESGSMPIMPLGPAPKLRSIMLNPGPSDAYDPRDKSLKLEMNGDGDPIPIADYLWFTLAADSKPRKPVRSLIMPPVETWTRN